jgi:tRNA threonylcarbamoyladenosine biosynthesis protein TsaE
MSEPGAPSSPRPEAGLAEVGPLELDQPGLEAWGEAIGRTVAVPIVLALRGQLGAGKSVLARAVARGAGVTGHMPSPTFNLLYRYRAARGIDVVHLDLYRLERPDEVWELGWAELGVGAEIVLMEWPGRAEALLPPDRWDIELEIPTDDAVVRRLCARRVGGAPALPVPAGCRPLNGGVGR